MAFNQTDITAFERAMADSRGALEISFGDQTVRFESLAARAAFLAEMKRAVNASTRQSFRLAATSKGV